MQTNTTSSVPRAFGRRPLHRSWCALARNCALSAALALGLLAGAVGNAKAAVVTLEVYLDGQQFLQTINGPSYLPINGQNTTSFLITGSGGELRGDVVTHNNGGTQFDFKITNMHLEGYYHGVDTVASIQAVQTFESPTPITWTASHSLTGSSDFSSSFIHVATTHDYMGSNVALTPLETGGPGPFSDGPYSATVTQASAGVYSIYAYMEMEINGGKGVIDLPGSYETSSIPVPTPAAGSLGAIAMLAAARRARSHVARPTMS